MAPSSISSVERLFQWKGKVMSLRTGPRIPESEDAVKSDVLTPQHQGDCMLKRIGRRIFFRLQLKGKVSFLRLGIRCGFSDWATMPK